MDIRRKENESFLDWKLRLITAKIDREIDLDWSEIRDLLGLDCSPDHLRKTAYGVYEYKDYFNNKLKQNITDGQILDQFELKRLEIEKERKKLQSEKHEINKWLREQGRAELFYEKLIDAVKKQSPINIPKYKISREIGEIDIVTEIADSHYGREVVVRGLEDEILNKYNTEVFERRMWDLLNQIIIKLEKENHKHVNLFNLSDSIDGILRMSQLQTLQLGVVDSVIGFGSFIANWINELSKYAYVDYYPAEGNHTEIRPLGSSRGDFPHENVEKLITWYIQGMLKDNHNVAIHPNKYFQYVDVVGTKILATHGQDEKNLEQSIKDYIHTYRKPIHILLTGHLHNSHEKTVGMDEVQNIKFVQAPSICGIDDYSMKLKKTSHAGSIMMVFERGYGRTTTYDLKLK